MVDSPVPPAGFEIRLSDKRVGDAVHAAAGVIVATLTKPRTAELILYCWHDEPDFSDVDFTSVAPGQTRTTRSKFVNRAINLAISLPPDAALQLAMGILQNLGNLPDEVKQTYGLPQNINVAQGAPNAA